MPSAEAVGTWLQGQIGAADLAALRAMDPQDLTEAAASAGFIPWGTVDGAWESGEPAAEAALRRIGALRDEPAKQAPAVKRRRSGDLPRAGLPGTAVN